MQPRRHYVGFLFLGLALGAFGGASAAPSSGSSWDGAWGGGWDKDDGIRIVIAGDRVTSVYRDGAYRQILSSEASPEGTMLVVWWVGGDGFLQRARDDEATISLRERARPVYGFTLRRE